MQTFTDCLLCQLLQRQSKQKQNKGLLSDEGSIYLGQGDFLIRWCLSREVKGEREPCGSHGQECSRQMQEPEQPVLPGQVPGKATATSLEGRDWGWGTVM